jgi:hypothetical protein
MSISVRTGYAAGSVLLLVIAANFALLSGWTFDPPGNRALAGGVPALVLSAVCGVAGMAFLLKACGREAWSPWLFVGLAFALWRGAVLLGL